MRVRTEYKTDDRKLHLPDYREYIKKELSMKFGVYITEQDPTLIKEIPEPIKENEKLSSDFPVYLTDEMRFDYLPQTKFEIDVFIMKKETYQELGKYLKSIGMNENYLKQVQSFFNDKY